MPRTSPLSSPTSSFGITSLNFPTTNSLLPYFLRFHQVMRIPFPSTLSVGTDIVSIARFAKYLGPNNESRLSQLTARFLVRAEIRDFKTRFGTQELQFQQDTRNVNRAASWLAGRWAAKEAAKKAWGANLLSFKDLRIEAGPSGAVEVVCAPASGPAAAKSASILEQVAKLSISHEMDATAGFAVATVLATPLHQDIVSELERQKAQAEGKLGRGAVIGPVGYREVKEK